MVYIECCEQFDLKNIIMEVLREYAQFQLNKGYGMARGLYNVYNTESGEVSLWFDEDTKELLMRVSDKEFINRCKEMVSY